MRISAPIYKLKRQAKLLARQQGLALHMALDRVASDEGFTSWSHLSASYQPGPAVQVLQALAPGDMVLLAALPGQDKTRLGLEMAQQVGRIGRRGMFFTLEFTHLDIDAVLEVLLSDGQVLIDTSDDICAKTIIAQMARQAEPVLVVVEHLQALDHRRDTPALPDQLAALKALATATGAIVAMISQIDRRFELGQDRLPGVEDIRMLNPFDPAVFDKACFLQDGAVHLEHLAA